MSPTARSLKRLRELGYHADVVERWIPGANIRRDFLGGVDILAYAEDGRPAQAIQATTWTNVLARQKKLAALPGTRALIASGVEVRVWGWRRECHDGRRPIWAVRDILLTPADLTSAAELPDLP